MIHLESIDIKNLGGLTEFSAKFSEVSIVLGANEAGKSSFLSSVATTFHGGSDSDLLHNGAKKGSVDIRYANGYRTIKTIEPAKKPGYSLVVEDPNGGRLTQGAATKIAEWVPKEGFDVRDLVRMVLYDQKGLEKFLLSNFPLTFTPEEVNPLLRGMGGIRATIPLSEFNALRTARYDDRTNVKRDAKEAQATLSTLEGQLLPDGDTDWKRERDKLDGELSAVDAEVSALKATIDLEVEQELNRVKAEASAAIAELRQKISELESGVRENESRLKAKGAELLAENRKAIDLRRDEFVKLRAAASSNADREQQQIGLKQTIDKQRERLDGHITTETILDRVIEDMDKLKSQKLKSLPIDGLDINTDGKIPVITIKGVPLQKVNTQGQIYLVAKFISAAQKASGCEMKILVCEGAELDSSHIIELGEACMEAEIQLIVSVCMAGHPLQVLDLAGYKALVGAA